MYMMRGLGFSATQCSEHSFALAHCTAARVSCTVRDIVHTARGAASMHSHSPGATRGPGFGAAQVAQARTLCAGEDTMRRTGTGSVTQCRHTEYPAPASIHLHRERRAVRAQTRDLSPLRTMVLAQLRGPATWRKRARGVCSNCAQGTAASAPRVRARRRATTARICRHARRVDADAARGTRKGIRAEGRHTHGVTQTADTAQCAVHLRSCGIVHAAWTPDSDARVCVDWAERKVRTVSQQARYKCCDAPPRFATRTWPASRVVGDAGLREVSQRLCNC
ncbi:hypothetical protein B0H10DRAFT_1955143 [Mycena sp. CBHHK59/15]|nr:hypothetical protein B0H10DRAFT_1955143 [Mycena sp. CBHHK59/15]